MQLTCGKDLLPSSLIRPSKWPSLGLEGGVGRFAEAADALSWELQG